MANPSTDEWSPAYWRDQVDRTKKTLDRIIGRTPPVAGRLIPDADDLPIHDGRRLEATVMFLDISKFSTRQSETAEEQRLLMQVLAFFFSEMIRIIEDYGGVVEKNTGDGLMAYFQSGSNDGGEKRALAAALTMFAASQHFINPVLAESGIDPLAFRICMDKGHITVAKIGAARRFSGLVAVGTTANIASKMLSIAEPNTILVGSRMLAGIPLAWRMNWVRAHAALSGWFYRDTGTPYQFWIYDGRWTVPHHDR